MIVFGVLTAAGLGVLTAGLLIFHALTYGAFTILAPEEQAAPPHGGRYVLAFAVGVMAYFATASASIWLASRTTIRTWPPVALGLAASLVAATSGSCALLLVLGISPAGFLLDL